MTQPPLGTRETPTLRAIERVAPDHSEETTTIGPRSAEGGSPWGATRLRALAPLIAVVALLAAATGAASGIGAGTSSVHPGPASAVFTVALTLIALFGAVCIVVVVRALQVTRGRRDGRERRRSTLRERLIALATLGLLVLAAFLLELRRAKRGPRLGGGMGATALHPHGPSPVHFEMPAAGLTLLAVVALVALAIGVPAWTRHQRVRGRRLSSLDLVDDPAWTGGEADGAVQDALMGVSVADATEEPDPRRAIVAAYVAMTEAVAEAGAARRRRDETASEYLRHVLTEAGAPRQPAGRLTAVFERARYSSAPVDEDDRTLAISCLREIRVAMASVTGRAGLARDVVEAVS